MQLPAPDPSANSSSEKKRTGSRLLVTSTALLLGVLAAGAFYFRRKPEPSAPTPAPSVPIYITAPQPSQASSSTLETASIKPEIRPEHDLPPTAMVAASAKSPTNKPDDAPTKPAPKPELSTSTSLAPGATAQFQVPLPYNQVGIYSVGAIMPAGVGFDFSGNAYSPFKDFIAHGETLRNGTTFKIGLPDERDFVRVSHPPLILKLTGQRYSKVCILAAAVNGNQLSQVFTIRYKGDPPSEHSFVQSMSDWAKTDQRRYANETLIVQKARTSGSDGTFKPTHSGLFEYEFPLDRSKGVHSLTLPANKYVGIFAVTLVP